MYDYGSHNSLQSKDRCLIIIDFDIGIALDETSRWKLLLKARHFRNAAFRERVKTYYTKQVYYNHIDRVIWERPPWVYMFIRAINLMS